MTDESQRPSWALNLVPGSATLPDGRTLHFCDVEMTFKQEGQCVAVLWDKQRVELPEHIKDEYMNWFPGFTYKG